MQTSIEAQVMPDNSIMVPHTITEVCMACGYDLTEEELAADRCADCGADLEIRRSVSLELVGLSIFGVSEM
jgi:predicted RNA-binding Zn-ribbon protein involved in translation (DUF1610 family)